MFNNFSKCNVKRFLLLCINMNVSVFNSRLLFRFYYYVINNIHIIACSMMKFITFKTIIVSLCEALMIV